MLFESLVAQIADALLTHQLRLAVAESCTGGLVSAALTERAGSSNWFECGFVTYSNSAKMELLQVSDATLQAHGAVSQNTVTEMVAGALTAAKVDVAIAVSGIAGPSGGSTEKPVGTVYFAWGDRQHIRSERKYFAGDRQAVRLQAVEYALIGLLAHLERA